jgi:hypothetical protein
MLQNWSAGPDALENSEPLSNTGKLGKRVHVPSWIRIRGPTELTAKETKRMDTEITIISLQYNNISGDRD